MLYALEEAAKAGLPFYVLDRPDPVTGVHVEGPLLDADLHSFVGCYAMPVRYGMTIGELATMANSERQLHADLHVVKMANWQPGDWFDSTGLAWIDPSPNMRNLNAALLYDGLALLEASKGYSVGRGTDAPFEQIGADWIHGPELAQFLNARSIPGVRAYPTRFEPTASVFSRANPSRRSPLRGLESGATFNSIRLGLEVAYALQKLYPGKIDFDACRLSIGSRKVIEAMKTGTDPGTIEQSVAEDVRLFVGRRKPFLLY